MSYNRKFENQFKLVHFLDLFTENYEISIELIFYSKSKNQLFKRLVHFNVFEVCLSQFGIN